MGPFHCLRAGISWCPLFFLIHGSTCQGQEQWHPVCSVNCVSHPFAQQPRKTSAPGFPSGLASWPSCSQKVFVPFLVALGFGLYLPLEPRVTYCGSEVLICFSSQAGRLRPLGISCRPEVSPRGLMGSGQHHGWTGREGGDRLLSVIVSCQHYQGTSPGGGCWGHFCSCPPEPTALSL
jgi:hypothetical protein